MTEDSSHNPQRPQPAEAPPPPIWYDTSKGGVDPLVASGPAQPDRPGARETTPTLPTFPPPAGAPYSPSSPDPTLRIPVAPPPQAPGPPTPGTSSPSRAPRRGARPVELAVVALLAAALASGGTVIGGQLFGTTGSPTATPTSSSRTTTQSPALAAPVIDATGVNWAAVAKKVTPSVVSITVETSGGGGQGSGVLIDTEGHILTNNHVVQGASGRGAVSVTLADGRTFDATIDGTDPSTDLAVVKLTGAPKDLAAISVGSSSTLTVGDPVMAVGNPLGLAGTVTTGIVSALNRPVTTGGSGSGSGGQASEPVVTNAIQTSAAINPGNSGGALVDSAGRLVGINSSIASLGSSTGSQAGSIGIGFAIPVDEAMSIAGQLIDKGVAQHAYLGVSSGDTVAADGTAKRAAALVKTVSAGTPAATAGLKSGDAIIAVNGEQIDGSLSLVAQIRERSVGDKVTLTLLRQGKRSEIAVTLAVRPSASG